jgi:hypothetical protein
VLNRTTHKMLPWSNTVTVVAKGYVWREATYASLSIIARAITGTAWNGPRFFGLRIDKGTTVSPTRRRERPTGDILPGIQEPGHGGPPWHNVRATNPLP